MARRRRRKKRRIPIIIFIAIFLFLGSFLNAYRANPLNQDGDQSWSNPLEILKGKRERINILVFGVDSLGKNGGKGSRSDSIMLFTLDPDKEKPSIISIPRDTRVKIPGRKNFDKINHAHAYGGPELLVDTVEEFLDIHINYYVGINYNVVIEVVDALGGVEIDVPIDMKYSDPYDNPPLNIDIKKGLQVLNGEQSVHFMRFRKGYANQDLGRIKAQQQFVEALIDRVLSPSTILKVPQLVDIVYNNVETDIPKSKMVSLGIAATSINIEHLNKITVEGVPKTINGISYYVVTEDAIDELKSEYFNDANSSLESNE